MMIKVSVLSSREILLLLQGDFTKQNMVRFAYLITRMYVKFMVTQNHLNNTVTFRSDHCQDFSNLFVKFKL